MERREAIAAAGFFVKRPYVHRPRYYTRSLPFGFRSVNRKLQLRLVCNEHNGDGSRVKVGQLERRGKRASERRRSDKKSGMRYAALRRSTRDPSLFSSTARKEIQRRNGPFDRDRSREKRTKIEGRLVRRISRGSYQPPAVACLCDALYNACLDKPQHRPPSVNYAATSHPSGNKRSPVFRVISVATKITLAPRVADGIHYGRH